MKPKKPKTRTVTTDNATTYTLPSREPTGLVPCPGDAHSNPHIDNCMICAPDWGHVMSYKPLTVDDVKPGIAVPVSSTRSLDDKAARASFKAAEGAGLITMVMVTEKTKASTSSFFAYVVPS